MSKSFIRWSKCSGTTKAKILSIVKSGERTTRRQFVAAQRRAWKMKGGLFEN